MILITVELLKMVGIIADDIKALGNEVPKTKTQYCLSTCLYKKTGVVSTCILIMYVLNIKINNYPY